MEFVAAKKSKNRKRKRNAKNKRRVRRKLEVKAATRPRSFSHNVTSAMRDESRTRTMNAQSFWENYKLSQDWQQRHSVAWWKSRCYALEHENNILRQKIRTQSYQRGRYATSRFVEKKCKVPETCDNDEDDENLEFQVDKDMLDFLEQSIRHKIELKRSRESETEAATSDTNNDATFVSSEARIRAKAEDAKLLYGEASPGIMAMEAALQATMDRHKDRAKPHFWPNIPLKP